MNSPKGDSDSEVSEVEEGDDSGIRMQITNVENPYVMQSSLL